MCWARDKYFHDSETNVMPLILHSPHRHIPGKDNAAGRHDIVPRQASSAPTDLPSLTISITSPVSSTAGAVPPPHIAALNPVALHVLYLSPSDLASMHIAVGPCIPRPLKNAILANLYPSRRHLATCLTALCLPREPAATVDVRAAGICDHLQYILTQLHFPPLKDFFKLISHLNVFCTKSSHYNPLGALFGQFGPFLFSIISISCIFKPFPCVYCFALTGII